MNESKITNDDQSGNYLVEVFAKKKRINSFQTRTRDDAVEEAWKVYRSRSVSTNRITRKVKICRMWKLRPGKWKFTDTEDIARDLRRRWEQSFDER